MWIGFFWFPLIVRPLLMPLLLHSLCFVACPVGGAGCLLDGGGLPPFIWDGYLAALGREHRSDKTKEYDGQTVFHRNKYILRCPLVRCSLPSPSLPTFPPAATIQGKPVSKPLPAPLGPSIYTYVPRRPVHLPLLEDQRLQITALLVLGLDGLDDGREVCDVLHGPG